MELLVANFAGKVRREQLHGRDYLVAPLTLIVPGVLNGSNGPLYYPLEDIRATNDAWNGIPLVVNHPRSSDGKPVSARIPAVLEQYGIGWVFNAVAEDRQAAEGWFDVDRTRKVDHRILAAIQNGDKVELSTGLNLDLESVAGVWNNSRGESIPYTAIARRYRPDHLAILPDDKGACSVKDGCGVNNQNGEREPQTNEEKKMSKLSDADRTKLIDSLVANCDCWKEDRATLEKADDKMLTSLNSAVETQAKVKEHEKLVQQQEAIVNAAKKGFKIGDQQYVMNDKGEYIAEGKQEPAKVEPPKEPPVASVDNAAQRLTAEEQEAIAFANNFRNQRKAELIDALTANMADDDKKKAHKERLAKRSLKDLEEDVELLPKKTTNQESHYYPELPQSRPSFLGAGAGQQVANTEDKPTPLGIPVWNFEPAKN